MPSVTITVNSKKATGGVDRTYALILTVGVVLHQLLNPGEFGDFGTMAVTISLVYVLGFLATFFLPKTKGRPLPENIQLETLPTLSSRNVRSQRDGYLSRTTTSAGFWLRRFTSSLRLSKTLHRTSYPYDNKDSAHGLLG